MIGVDAAFIARALKLSPDAFRKLMDHGHIRTLSERGTGVDEGYFRLSFYYRDRRCRSPTDRAGHMIACDQRQSRPSNRAISHRS